MRRLALGMAVACAGCASGAAPEAPEPCSDARTVEVAHGAHVHVVPVPYSAQVPLRAFPTRRPGPDSTVAPDGTIVPRCARGAA